MTQTKIILEYADFQQLMAKIESIERKVSAFDAPQERTNENGLIPRLEAAEYLGVGRTSFDKIVKQGELPYVVVGKTKRYLKKDLDEYKNRNRSGHGVGALLPDAKRRRRRVHA